MPDVAHSALTGSDLHELKGASSASADTIPVADGAGSTVFEKLTADSVDTTSLFNVNKRELCVRIADVSTAELIYVPIPWASTITKITSALSATIVTDSTIDFLNHAGGNMGTITITASGSAAKDVDSLSPSSNNTFTAGQVLTIDANGESTNTAPVILVIELTQTS